LGFGRSQGKNASPARRLTTLADGFVHRTAQSDRDLPRSAWLDSIQTVAGPRRIRKVMIRLKINFGDQNLARMQNCPAEPALGLATLASSTEISTGSVDNFT
jgi:hypothetical protein